jgi:hypothetical protein
VLNYLCKVYWLTIRYCDDLNFAANRNFSRTPTSGTGRDEAAREGAKDIKGGTDAILMGFTTVAPCVCVCVFVLKGGRLGGVFPVQQVLANPWRKTVSAGRIVQRELQPYAAADLGFIHEGQRPYASADQISPPRWAAVIPQDPTIESDLTPDSPRPRIPKTRNRNYLARSLSVIFSSSAILANFFYTVCVIGPEVTSPEKTSRLVLDKFFFCLSLFTSGLFSYFITFHP